MAAILEVATPISPVIENKLCTEAEYFAFDETHSGYWEFRPVSALELRLSLADLYDLVELEPER